MLAIIIDNYIFKHKFGLHTKATPYIKGGLKRSKPIITGACAAEHRSYHIAGGIPVE